MANFKGKIISGSNNTVTQASARGIWTPTDALVYKLEGNWPYTLPPTWNTAAGALASSSNAAAYSQSVSASPGAGGGVGVIYSVVSDSNSLFSSLSLNSSTGLISGTMPTIASDTTYNFTIRASNSLGTLYEDRSFSITSIFAISVRMKLWGAAGQGLDVTGQCGTAGEYGGAGGFLDVYTDSAIPIGSTLYIYVGSGGGVTPKTGDYAASTSPYAQGGGATFVYLNGVKGTGTLLAVAGAGGARGASGGGTTGQSWPAASSTTGGGTQSAGGAGGTGGFGGAGPGGAGGFLSGGIGSGCKGMGGGSGYYGGGGGSGDCGACPGVGGGGGSSYFNTTYFPTATTNAQGTDRSGSSYNATIATYSGGYNDSDYPGGNVGNGVKVSPFYGGNGHCVIYKAGVKTSYSHTTVAPYYYTLSIS